MRKSIVLGTVVMLMVILSLIIKVIPNNTKVTTIESNNQEVLPLTILDSNNFDIVKEPPSFNDYLIVTTEEATEEAIEKQTEITEEKTTKFKKKKKKKEKKYTEDELYIMSHLIMGEAGNCSYEMQLYVGSIVLNRVKDNRFPDTIKEVVFQSGQYACTWDGNYNKKPTKSCRKAAKYLLKNGSQLPKYVIFQAEFLQGDSVYMQIGNTYFCYWKKDVK